ncbi:MAG: DNA-binding protein [Hungatella sp.]
MQLHEIIVGKGQDIKATLESYLIEHGIRDAYVSGGVGSVCDLVLQAPENTEMPLKLGQFTCKLPAEILSLSGEIMGRESMDEGMKRAYPENGSPLFIHLHASVAISGGHVYGGGLVSGQALRLLKIYLFTTKEEGMV